MSIDERLSSDAIGGQARARVEADPAKPQDAGTEHGERQVVRRHRDGSVTPSVADDDDHGERCDSGVDVDGGASSEVEGTHVEQPTVEDPLGGRDVDEQ